MTGSTFIALEMKDFNSINSQAYGQGMTAQCSLNTTTNIDLSLPDDVYVIGGVLLVDNATWGDYLDLKIVDVDNILGFGANSVVKTVISNFYVTSDRQLQAQFSVLTPNAKVRGGLYLRIVYHSTALVGAAKFAGNFIFQKVLI